MDEIRAEFESFFPGGFASLVLRVKEALEDEAYEWNTERRLFGWLLNTKEVFDHVPFFLAIAYALETQQALAEDDHETALELFNDASRFVNKGDLLARSEKRKAARRIAALASTRVRDPARGELLRLIGFERLGPELSDAQAKDLLYEKLTTFVQVNYDTRPKKTKKEQERDKVKVTLMTRREKDNAREEERRHAEKPGKWPRFDASRWIALQLKNNSAIRTAWEQARGSH